MLAELHSHSTYSMQKKVIIEGLNTPDEMAAHAKRIGLGAIAITDHDVALSTSVAKKLSKKHGIIVIPGEEVGTMDGHVLALGINERIEECLSAEETIERIHDQGGIAIASHPFDVYRKGIRQLAAKCDAVEVFNALNHDRISNLKGLRFAEKRNMAMVAGSDAHCIAMLGNGVINLEASDMDGVLKAIKKGNVTISARYTPPLILMDWTMRRLKLSYMHVTEYINDNYSLPKRFVAQRLLSLVKQYPGNIRYFFNAITYFGVGSVIAYSAVREIFSIR